MGEWSTPRPGRFTSGKDLLFRRMGGPPGPVWTGAENLASNGIRSPDLPSPYRVAILTELSGASIVVVVVVIIIIIIIIIIIMRCCQSSLLSLVVSTL